MKNRLVIDNDYIGVVVLKCLEDNLECNVEVMKEEIDNVDNWDWFININKKLLDLIYELKLYLSRWGKKEDFIIEDVEILELIFEIDLKEWLKDILQEVVRVSLKVWNSLSYKEKCNIMFWGMVKLKVNKGVKQYEGCSKKRY